MFFRKKDAVKTEAKVETKADVKTDVKVEAGADTKSNDTDKNKPEVVSIPKTLTLPKRVFIFDFDWTIPKNLPHLLGVINDAIPVYKLELTKLTTYQELINLKSNLTWNDKKKLVSKQKLLRDQTLERLKSEVKETPIFEGLKELITHLKQMGAVLGLVTTNREDTVREFLQIHNIDHFNFIKASNGELGVKDSLLEDLVKEGVKKQEISKTDYKVYIAGAIDEAYTTAKKMVNMVVAAGWGYENKDNFAKHKHKADHVVDSPDGMISVLNLNPTEQNKTGDTSTSEATVTTTVVSEPIAVIDSIADEPIRPKF